LRGHDGQRGGLEARQHPDLLGPGADGAVQEAGVPDGVINLVYATAPRRARCLFNHRDLPAFTSPALRACSRTSGKTIGQNIHKYKSYPRIVGENRRKDFILAHLGHAKAVARLYARRFEYQGQKWFGLPRG
jgi:1-pyrroline-5-carboxylate dehydrogenase